MKNLLTLLIALGFVFGVSACGGSTTSEETSTEAVEAVEEVAAEEAVEEAPAEEAVEGEEEEAAEETEEETGEQ